MSVGFGGYRRPDGGGALRLDLNEAPRQPAAAFRERLLANLAAVDWRRYPDIDARSARESAAALYGWRAAGTLVGNGSNELLAAALRALLPAAGTVATLAPSFSMYPVLAARLGARLEVVRLEPPAFSPGPDALLAAAAVADVTVVASPNNPTGGELDEGLLERLLDFGRPVVWDAAYAEFGRLDPVEWLGGRDNLVVLRSFSKAWGLAGMRVGALLAGDAMAARVAAELLPFGTGWIVPAAFRTAVEMPEAGRALVAETVAERRRQLAAIAAMPGFEAVDSAGNFYLLRRRGFDGAALAASLGAAGIRPRQIEELSACGFVRVTVGSAEEGDALLAALREVDHG